MYYEDEYEDLEDYEDYCSECGFHYDRCYCPVMWSGDMAVVYEVCTCGALRDADGNCPYCDLQEMMN